jgi:hypothetical protein
VSLHGEGVGELVGASVGSGEGETVGDLVGAPVGHSPQLSLQTLALEEEQKPGMASTQNSQVSATSAHFAGESVGSSVGETVGCVGHSSQVSLQTPALEEEQKPGMASAQSTQVSATSAHLVGESVGSGVGESVGRIESGKFRS